MRGLTRAGPWSAVLCAAALLLPGCGSSDDQSQSNQPRTNADVHRQAKSDSTNDSGVTSSADPQEKAKRLKGSGPAETDAAKPGARAGGGQDQAPEPVHNSRNPVQIKGCSTGMTKRQCEAVGKAYQQQQGSNPDVVKEGECPAAMSKAECEAAGEAFEETQEGRPVKPSECPRAMTAEQCAEAGKAYEEAAQ